MKHPNIHTPGQPPVHFSLNQTKTMVPLPTVRSLNAQLAQSHPLVAVFIGGTAGIGSYTVHALASTYAAHSTLPLRAYIVGRNRAAAEKICAECKAVYPRREYIFVQAVDLALLRDVDQVCGEIGELERRREEEGGERIGRARVDLLVLTQGVLTFSRNESKEGLDSTFSLMYYSRMRFIFQLLPLLTASPLSGRVISVLHPGMEGQIVPSDLSMRRHSILRLSMSHQCFMTTFFMEEIAKRHPGKIALSHVYPGIVMTDMLEHGTVPWWARALWRWVVGPVMRLWETPGEVCGERLLFLMGERYPALGTGRKGDGDMGIVTAVDGTLGGGVYNINSVGEVVPTSNKYEKVRAAGVPDVVWKHTMQVFEEIEAGKVFSG
ncbi:short-chain dehydrogenase reductase protein [Rutstroemia sp. NJR-2017a BVV2]|nr:short-chain dehydrogenase reductase protein [Rutstroemia sp. NJR-2017a BVV2]